MLDKWYRKEKPVFTGISRGVGGFSFGGGVGGGPSGPPDGSADNPFTQHSDLAGTTTSGNYYFKTASMTSAVEYYLDTTTAASENEKYIRIWVSAQNNYDTTSYSWDSNQTPNLINDSNRWMYGFVNPSNNTVAQPWTWTYYSGTHPSAFKDNPPMAHGGDGSPLITRTNATRVSDGNDYNGYYLRTGYSSFSSECDDNRSGTWGQICMKGSNTDSGTGQGGLLNFPHYASFANNGGDHCGNSSDSYSDTDCSDTRRFAIYVKLTDT